MRRAAVTAVAAILLLSAVFVGVRTLRRPDAVAHSRTVSGSADPTATPGEPRERAVMTPGSSVPSATAGAVHPGGTGPRTTTIPSGPAGSWFTVTLGATCVVPGGTQSLTGYSRPGYSVSFNSQYPDGKFGNKYGGYGVLATDANGVAHATWTVAPSAPLGTVTVAIGTANGGPATVTHQTFTVAARC